MPRFYEFQFSLGRQGSEKSGRIDRLKRNRSSSRGNNRGRRRTKLVKPREPNRSKEDRDGTRAFSFV